MYSSLIHLNILDSVEVKIGPLLHKGNTESCRQLSPLAFPSGIIIGTAFAKT